MICWARPGGPDCFVLHAINMINILKFRNGNVTEFDEIEGDGVGYWMSKTHGWILKSLTNPAMSLGHPVMVAVRRGPGPKSDFIFFGVDKNRQKMVKMS